MRLSISEILKKVSESKKFEERIDLLRQYDNTTLRGILQLCYDKNIKWHLPEGTPPYKENIYLGQQGNLYKEMRKMYLFLEGGNTNLTKVKRESLFIQLLETLSPDDAKLLCSVKDKKMPYKNITVHLVNTAFPGLIPEEQKEEKNGQDL